MHLSEPGTLLFASLLILWVSGILSGLVDNIPFVAVAIPLVARLTTGLTGDVEILWWALALGACLGGNLTPIGASANVTVIGMADRAGAPISFRAFTRFGSAITAISLLIPAGSWSPTCTWAGVRRSSRGRPASRVMPCYGWRSGGDRPRRLASRPATASSRDTAGPRRPGCFPAANRGPERSAGKRPRAGSAPRWPSPAGW